MDERQLGQLLLTGVPGTELDSETAARFRKLQPGGFILFGRNISEPEQLRKLIDDLRDLSEIEPFITIDQEGGRVSRLRMIGSEPPNAQQLREKGDLDLIKRHGNQFAVRILGPNSRASHSGDALIVDSGEARFGCVPLIVDDWSAWEAAINRLGEPRNA